ISKRRYSTVKYNVTTWESTSAIRPNSTRSMDGLFLRKYSAYLIYVLDAKRE
ncbi:4614_t:CDS:2, partial [Racocetra persica]